MFYYFLFIKFVYYLYKCFYNICKRLFIGCKIYLCIKDLILCNSNLIEMY